MKTKAQIMASSLIVLLEAMNALRSDIATILSVKPTSVTLGIGKDGMSFDLTVALTADDNSARLAQMLEIVGIDGLVFHDIQTKPALGTVSRRITARVLSREQIIAIAA